MAEAITALAEAVCDASRAESVALGTARRERDAAQDRVVQLASELGVRTAERDELAGQLARVRAERDAALLSNSNAREALDAAGCGSGSLADCISGLAGEAAKAVADRQRIARKFDEAIRGRNEAIRERDRAIAERDTAERAAEQSTADTYSRKGEEMGCTEYARHTFTLRRVNQKSPLWQDLSDAERRVWCALAVVRETAEQELSAARKGSPS